MELSSSFIVQGGFNIDRGQQRRPDPSRPKLSSMRVNVMTFDSETAQEFINEVEQTNSAIVGCNMCASLTSMKVYGQHLGNKHRKA